MFIGNLVGYRRVVLLERNYEEDIGAFLCFTVTIRCKGLRTQPYTEYQQFLLDTIFWLKSEGLGYRKVAQWLREHGYKTLRGKRFFAQHVYSMIKKHKLREEKLNHKSELEYGPLRFEYVDHTPSY